MKTTFRKQIILLVALLLAGVNFASAQFVRGDVNGDNVVDITDVTTLVDYIHGTPFPKAQRTLTFAMATSVNKAFGDANFTNDATPSAGTGDGTLTYESSNTAVATVDANTGEVTITGVGETTITANITEGSYYADASNTYTLMVSAGTACVTAAPTGKTGMIYTGEAQGLVDATSASCTGGTLVYSKTVDGIYGAASTITETNAGTYSFYYKVQGDDNHDDTAPVLVTGVSISRKPATITLSSEALSLKCNATATFTATLSDAEAGTTVTATSGNTTYYTASAGNLSNNVSTITITGSSIGTADCTVSATSANYSYTTVTKSITVKADGPTTLSELKTAIMNGTNCSAYLGYEVNSNGDIAASGVSGTKIGYVAWISGSNQDADESVSGSRILVIAASDAATSIKWTNGEYLNTETGITDIKTAKYNGYANTKAMYDLNSSDFAAATAAWNYSVSIPTGGATPAHWFMPSKIQWDKMGFNDAYEPSGNDYWSSTERDSASVYYMIVSSHGTSFWSNKQEAYAVRAVFAY